MSKKQKKSSVIILFIYTVFLTWLILFKLGLNLNQLHGYRRINLIPFQASVMINGKIQLSEIVYNILVFVPLGVYIAIFKQEWSLFKKVLPCFTLSFIYELIQYVFAIGGSDITDIIGNTLGGLLGVGLCWILKILLKKRCVNVVNIIGIIIEVIAVALSIMIAAQR